MSEPIAGPWEIRSRKGGEMVAHETVWTVMTDDAGRLGAFALRVGGHGQSAFDDDALTILLSPEMAHGLVWQFVNETVPYAERLPR